MKRDGVCLGIIIGLALLVGTASAETKVSADGLVGGSDNTLTTSKLMPVLDHYVIREGGTYTITLTQSPDYIGRLSIRSYKCDLIFQNTCTSPTETRLWGPDGGWVFVNGVATITPESAATYGIYHMQLSFPDVGNWSDEIQLTLVPAGATESYVVSQTEELVRRIITSYPLESQQALDPDGNGVDTIAEVETRYEGSLSAPDLAHKRAEIFVGKVPDCGISLTNQTCRTETATWRKKIAARHLMLADYYFAKYELSVPGSSSADLLRAHDHFYQMILQMDILSSLPEHGMPVAEMMSNNGYRFTLGDTSYSHRYLADFAMGGLKGAALLRDRGLFPSSYCSYTERRECGDAECPSTDRYGFRCSQVDLNERLAVVSSAVGASVATKWMYYKDAYGVVRVRKHYWDNEEFWRSYPGYPFGETFSEPQGNDYVVRDLIGRDFILPSVMNQDMNPTFYSWQMTGMSAAAKTVISTGEANSTQMSTFGSLLSFGLRAVAYEFAANVPNPYCYNMHGMVNRSCDGILREININGDVILDCYGGTRELHSNYYSEPEKPFLVGNNWQHLGSILAAAGWESLPYDFSKTKDDYPLTLKATLWKDGNPYINFKQANYSKYTIEKYFPGSVCSCGDTSDSCMYYQRSDGTKTWYFTSVNEYAHDFAISSLPPYYRLMSELGDSDEALLSLGLSYLLYQSMLERLPSPLLVVGCNPNDGQFAGGSTAAGSVLRMVAFFMQTAYPAYNRVSY